MKLEDLEIYNLSMDLADKIYHVIEAFSIFQRDTLGKQWVRAVDSVSLNLGEGFGRYTFKDSRAFSIIARGSLYESKTCLEIAFRRSFISEELYNALLRDHNHLGVKLNNFINSQSNLMKKNDHK